MSKDEAAMFSAMEKLKEFKKEWCGKEDGTHRCELGCPFVDGKKCTVNEFIVKAKNYKRNLCRKCEYRKVMAKAFDIHFTDEKDCPLKECYYERKEKSDE